MKPDFIKICGLSTPEAIDAVIDGGATHAGFIFFEKSPRHIQLEQAKALSTHIDRRIPKVAVTVDADDNYLEAVIEAQEPDLLQLHGSESVARVKELKRQYGLPIIKVFSIRDAKDLDAAKPYVETADYLMLDAKAPKGSEIPGGNGVAFDWEIVDQWPKNVPYILSGGLNAQNVCEAISRTGTGAIDVSSGVESSPGIKEVTMIREFLDALKQES